MDPDLDAKVHALSQVLTLASLFSTCVEAFGLITSSHDSSTPQKVALASLGIEQGRLLVFGDVVGISAPPAHIATSMIPSVAGPTNPDPNEPIYFEVRDPRLDQADVREKVEHVLHEIVDRPGHVGREQMMALYGLKAPKKYTTTHPALDSNRLEGFREKYALLQDLWDQFSPTGRRHFAGRGMSITMQRWTIHDVAKFSAFVKMVRQQVDQLVALFDCKERVDRALRTDIKTMAWHPEMATEIVRKDWEKLRLITAACKDDYPDYVQAAQLALEHLDQQLRARTAPIRRMSSPTQTKKPLVVATTETKKKVQEKAAVAAVEAVKQGEAPRKRRPSFLSYFKRLSSYGSSSSSGKKKLQQQHHNETTEPARSKSLAVPKTTPVEDNALGTSRSKSVDAAITSDDAPESPVSNHEEPNDQPLIHARSKSLPGATPEMAALALDPPSIRPNPNEDVKRPPTSTLQAADPEAVDAGTTPLVPVNTTVTQRSLDGDINLAKADTVNSYIDRHDMFVGVGRMETKDIRDKSHVSAQKGGVW